MFSKWFVMVLLLLINWKVLLKAWKNNKVSVFTYKGKEVKDGVRSIRFAFEQYMQYWKDALDLGIPKYSKVHGKLMKMKKWFLFKNML